MSAALSRTKKKAAAVAPPLVVGNEEHRFMVLDQLRDIGTEPAAVLLEPVGRNTAPAMTLAALQAVLGLAQAFGSHLTLMDELMAATGPATAERLAAWEGRLPLPDARAAPAAP